MDKNVCQLCSINQQKYICPQCNVPYCSVKCYKSEQHQQCSETFYKKCVVQEMQSSSATGSDKITPNVQEMLKILQRQRNNENDDIPEEDDEEYDENSEPLDSDDDVDDHLDLASRLDGIDLNNADAIWEKLTDSERLDFEGLVKSGDVTNVVPIYIPWWDAEEPKIQEINVENEDDSIKMPQICKQIDEFSKISSKPAADCVPHNLCNILAAYTFVVRFYNGDHMMHPRDCCTLLIAVCSNLGKNGNFDDTLMAIESVAMECRNRGISIGVEEADLMKLDVGKLIKGRCANVKDNTLAALSDLVRLLKAAKKEGDHSCVATDGAGLFTKRFPEFVATDVPDKTKFNSCIRKIQYYLAFVNQ